MRARILLVLFLAAAAGVGGRSAFSQTGGGGDLMLWVEKNYPWENPLQSEVSINGKSVNTYTSETTDKIGEYIKEGWNTITVKTTVQEPATKNNGLNFRIGPMEKKGSKMVMSPVLWQFHNNTDWKFNDGKFSHPLGPGTKEVTLNFKLYYAGLQREGGEIKAGDYVLSSKPHYTPDWNAPVTATVWVNGTPLNSFTVAPRQIVITSLLKPGKNEIKLVSTRVKNVIQSNDVEFSLGGPAEWMVQDSKFTVKKVLQFESIQGWKMNPKSGVLTNQAKPDSETVERVIPFTLKEGP